MVIWIIGLSASGKTTLGRVLYGLWKKQSPNTVLLNGDDVRRFFQHDNISTDYTLEERKKNIDRICQLCLFLDRQGINVVCCNQGLFEESRIWNRQNYTRYFEVFIDVPLEILEKRDEKLLYQRAKAGEIKGVTGIDIPYPRPKNPDYVFDNSKDRSDFSDIAREILTLVQNK